MLVISKMSEHEEGGKTPEQVFLDKMKSCSVKMVSILDLYDPDLYPVNVLQQNKINWTQTQLAQEWKC